MNMNLHFMLRAEIDLTREKFHRLLITIPDEALKFPSKNPDWTNGEVLFLMSIAPLIIKTILKRNLVKNAYLRSIPNRVTGPLLQMTHEVFVRSRARSATRWSIAREYDETYAMVLGILEDIPGSGFEKVLVVSEKDPLLAESLTVEQLFHYVRDHFDTYRQQIDLGDASSRIHSV